MKRRLREPVSGLTHLAGVLLALIALVVLLTKAGGIARSYLDAGPVWRRAQAAVDGSSTLALGGSLPGYGLARRYRRLGHLPRDTLRRDSLDPRRRPRL